MDGVVLIAAGVTAAAVVILTFVLFRASAPRRSKASGRSGDGGGVMLFGDGGSGSTYSGRQSHHDRDKDSDGNGGGDGGGGGD